MSQEAESQVLDDEQQEDLFFESGGEQLPEAPEEKQEEPSGEQKAEEPEKEAPEFEVLDENRIKVGDQVFITKAALDEARGENREIKEKVGGLEEQLGRFANLKEELDAWRKERQGKEQEQEAQKFEEDPVGTLKEQVDELKRERETAKTEGEKAREQHEVLSRVQNTTAQLADDYMKENPEYPDAYQYMMEARQHELKMLGIAPDQIQNTINQEALQLSIRALQQGRNPAEIIHELAKSRGFVARKKDDDDSDLEKKLEKIEKGQENASTLAGGGGEAEETGFLKDVENMSDEEFDKLWADLESKSD
jgi:DNA repair exonuclease SbcCD ATPase subunit